MAVSVSASAQSREELLERRIQQLEARLKALEGEVSKRPRDSRSAGKGQGFDPAGRQQAAASAPASGGPPGASGQSTQQASTAPQEAFIARDNIPTLQSNKFEVSQSFDYGRGTSFIQNDRSFRATTTFRYGIANDVELALSIPYFSSQRRTNAFADTIVRNVSGLGDIAVQASGNLWKEGDWYPGAALTVGLSMPTGDHPYDLGNLQAGVTPNDPLSLNQASGHWVPRAAIQFFKSTDPLILFFGVGIDYAVPRSFGDIKVEPGFRYTYNMGFGFALSERSTLGVSVNGAISERLKVGGVPIANSVTEMLSARFTLIQRVGQDFWLEPSITVGLTDDAPDAAVSLSLRKRF
ncbi:hypothetical protein ACWIGM_14165 [Bosea sp. NPDC055332]